MKEMITESCRTAAAVLVYSQSRTAFQRPGGECIMDASWNKLCEKHYVHLQTKSHCTLERSTLG